MPADALPIPWPELQPGAVHYRREYRDILGRPMRGKVTITGSGAPVVVELVAGVLEVDLPPDTYRLATKLHTVDGFPVNDADEVTLP